MQTKKMKHFFLKEQMKNKVVCLVYSHVTNNQKEEAFDNIFEKEE